MEGQNDRQDKNNIPLIFDLGGIKISINFLSTNSRFLSVHLSTKQKFSCIIENEYYIHIYKLNISQEFKFVIMSMVFSSIELFIESNLGLLYPQDASYQSWKELFQQFSIKKTLKVFNCSCRTHNDGLILILQ